MTTTKLMRAAGMCALLAGLLFLLPQFIHPEDKVAEVTTSGWAVAAGVNMAMAVLALIGLTGIYLRQVKETGVLGLVGFVLVAIGFLMITITAYVEAVILPQVADAAPGYVSDFLATYIGGEVEGEVGGLGLASVVGSGCYLLGGLIFGVALFRAGIVARWAALLLSIGAVASLLAGVLPDSMMRTATWPTAIAMIGLGYSLWSERQIAVSEPVPGVGDPHLTPARV